jgi:hypothetical protein
MHPSVITENLENTSPAQAKSSASFRETPKPLSIEQPKFRSKDSGKNVKPIFENNDNKDDKP